MNKAVDDLFSQQLTRREFLTKAGLLLLAFTGISGLFKSLPNLLSPKSEKGFSSGPYGK